VVGYSGRLADPDDCSRHIVSRPPVLLVHGDADPVIPLEDMKEAAHVLSAAGVPVETEVRSNLGHMLDTVSVACGLAFLKRRFADLG
jgi:phospholipase/carboxylesterase